ncbi:protein of unknown function [Candidatus Nitrospira inopinata]|uniref:Uncharacterized protein n=1 Tax=Candidatus Nitrospira inopinata TaxID=1715989 RepID=A0A0S4KUV8_9BACT|nr:protein of unknown function [Candidatus Nitrospira inopinata]
MPILAALDPPIVHAIFSTFFSPIFLSIFLANVIATLRQHETIVTISFLMPGPAVVTSTVDRARTAIQRTGPTIVQTNSRLISTIIHFAGCRRNQESKAGDGS